MTFSLVLPLLLVALMLLLQANLAASQAKEGQDAVFRLGIMR